MKVCCQIRGIDSDKLITVENETAGYGRIILQINNEKVAIYGKELIKAVENCMND